MSLITFVFAVGLGYGIARRDFVKDLFYKVVPTEYIPPGFEQTPEQPQDNDGPLINLNDEVI
jgi:hypothetical protein